jgi:hypothetical protein
MAEVRGYPSPLRWDCLIALVPLLFYPWLRPSTRSRDAEATSAVLEPSKIQR